ncbi:MAG: hypothetical protein H6855_02600 [Rhodospirillales bacterium]|nr:hypothetical protein [Rhodospirillales bacterium]MCB9964956.1 hypothetical protein [Rhodospirillales bacterium]
MADSLEEQETYQGITAHKYTVSIEAELEGKTPAERRNMAETLKIDNLEKDCIYVVDDRGCSFNDPRIPSHPIFQSVKDRAQSLLDARGAQAHDAKQVLEAFEDLSAFPGRRFKEITDFMGGSLVFAATVQDVRDDLIRHGAENISDEHTSYVCLHLRTEKAGLLPEGGVFIQVAEQRKTRRITAADFVNKAHGRVYNSDDFDIPLYENESGLTIAELKRNNPEYLRKNTPTALAFREFTEFYQVPKLKCPIEPIPGQPENPDILRRNRIQTVRTSATESAYLNSLGVDRRTDIAPAFNSLADVERTLYTNDALVLDKIHPTGDILLDRFLQTEALLLFCHHAMLRSLGHPALAGKPIFVHESLAPYIEKTLGHFYNLRTLGHKPEDLFISFRSHKELGELQKTAWDMNEFRRSESVPEFHQMTQIDIERTLGVSLSQLGPVIGVLGSATTRLPSPNTDAQGIAAEFARAGYSVADGGCTKGAVHSAADHYVRAILGGNEDLKLIRVRVPIASKREGNVNTMFAGHTGESYIVLPTQKEMAGGNFSLGGQIHVMTKDHMCERQHAIMALADQYAILAGGIGTWSEDLTARYHNLRVHLTGEGFFPGFDLNREARPITYMNSMVPSGTRDIGYYDFRQAEYAGMPRSSRNLIRRAENVHFANAPKQVRAIIHRCLNERGGGPAKIPAQSEMALEV